MLPKHDVAGSNPVTRSIVPAEGSCLGRKNIIQLLNRYEVAVRAEGYSSATVSYMFQGVSYFAQYLGGIPDVSRIGVDDYRAFITALRVQTVWSGYQSRQAAVALAHLGEYLCPCGAGFLELAGA
jgi:hypothetical protein